LRQKKKQWPRVKKKTKKDTDGALGEEIHSNRKTGSMGRVENQATSRTEAKDGSGGNGPKVKGKKGTNQTKPNQKLRKKNNGKGQKKGHGLKKETDPKKDEETKKNRRPRQNGEEKYRADVLLGRGGSQRTLFQKMGEEKKEGKGVGRKGSRGEKKMGKGILEKTANGKREKREKKRDLKGNEMSGAENRNPEKRDLPKKKMTGESGLQGSFGHQKPQKGMVLGEGRQAPSGEKKKNPWGAKGRELRGET